ncbi:DUF4124 domain-containing protein [Guyparkeria halophila]|uniref:DUF4124 domain-containing protein n=1 Tax=Guyparkeria halophila TaxID=47960 RepID=A0ABZ0YW05_9GAMM|nr:DUF4124 domain-containing protein [Guyparkeria halophila]WQH16365.1 DUF4124 domain-containing protein [Guyparkeria halophila]
MRVVNGRSPHRIHLLWPLLLVLAPPLSAAKIYQYTNSAGETVFTDEPVEGATVHEVEDAPVIPMTPVDVPEPRQGDAGSTDRSAPSADAPRNTATGAGEASGTTTGGEAASREAGDEPAGYQHLSIVEPADGEVASRLHGSITVELVMQPNLRSGDRIRILVDGEARVRDSTGRRHLLNGLAPGAHELVAQIHRDGEVIKESAPVRFQLMTSSQ